MDAGSPSVGTKLNKYDTPPNISSSNVPDIKGSSAVGSELYKYDTPSWVSRPNPPFTFMYDAITDDDANNRQHAAWTIDANEQTFDLKDSMYTLKLKLKDFQNDRSPLSVLFLKRIDNLEDQDKAVKIILDDATTCVLSVYLKFGQDDRLGHHFDLPFGEQVYKQREFALDKPITIDHPEGRNISIITFSPTISSRNGYVKYTFRLSHDLVRRLQNHFCRTIRGPTFYTKPNGYRAKVELVVNEKIEAKIVFISGINDFGLDDYFLYEIEVKLVHSSGFHVVYHGRHDLETDRSHSYILGTYPFLVENKFIENDCLVIEVNVFQSKKATLDQLDKGEKKRALKITRIT